MNETHSWTSELHKVVRQQNSGAMEDFILAHSAVYLRIQKWKNYWNRSTFAKVTVKIKVAQFFLTHSVVPLTVANHRSRTVQFFGPPCKLHKVAEFLASILTHSSVFQSQYFSLKFCQFVKGPCLCCTQKLRHKMTLQSLMHSQTILFNHCITTDLHSVTNLF